jgi:hypothetical protein
MVLRRIPLDVKIQVVVNSVARPLIGTGLELAVLGLIAAATAVRNTILEGLARYLGIT